MTAADLATAAKRNQVPLGIAYMVGSTVMFAGRQSSRAVRPDLNGYSAAGDVPNLPGPLESLVTLAPSDWP